MALVKVLKTENLTENVSEFCIGRAYDALPASIPCKLPYILFRILGYFSFLKISLMSQFSILNPQIFSTYYLSPALSISDVYRALMSGFQLPKNCVKGLLCINTCPSVKWRVALGNGKMSVSSIFHTSWSFTSPTSFFLVITTRYAPDNKSL